MVDRDLLACANETLDADWRFSIAYNAALQSAAAALKACGFDVPKGGGTHHRMIESLRLTLEDDASVIEVLQQCRAKRGAGVYEAVGIASDAEAAELRELATKLRDRLRTWLKKKHPALLGGGSVAIKPGKRK